MTKSHKNNLIDWCCKKYWQTSPPTGSECTVRANHGYGTLYYLYF